MIDSRATRSAEAPRVSADLLGVRDDQRMRTPRPRIALPGFESDAAHGPAVPHAIPEIMELLRALSSSSSVRGGLKVIAQRLHEMTGMVVLVEDLPGTTRCVEPEAGSTGLGLPNWRAQPALEHARALRDGDWLLVGVRPDDALLGAVCVLDPGHDVGVELVSLVEAAAAVFAFLLSKDLAVAEMEARVWAGLASELLDDPSRDIARRHAAALGHSLDNPHRVVAIDLLAHRAGAVEAAVRRVSPHLHMNDVLLTTRGSLLLLLVSEDVDWTHFSALLAQELASPPRIGVGRPRAIELIRESLAEAELALRMSTTGVVEVDDLGVLGLLAADADPTRLQRLVDRSIGSLVAYDEAHRSELVATLAAYLQCHYGIETTARILFVHSNTVKYRIRQISELLLVDLHDPDTRFNLDLACRAHQVLEVLARKIPQ